MSTWFFTVLIWYGLGTSGKMTFEYTGPLARPTCQIMRESFGEDFIAEHMNKGIENIVVTDCLEKIDL